MAGSEAEDIRDAERRIAEAARNGAAALDLSELRLRALPQSISGLTSLRYIDFRSCEQLGDLGSLSTLTALQSLKLGECEQLSDLGPLSALAALQSLSLFRCEKLSDLGPLSTLTALQSLRLFGCKQLNDLGPLSTLTALHSLDLFACEQLSELGPLSMLTALQSLNLSWCDRLSDLRPLSTLTALQSLDLCRCNRLSDLRPLSTLTTLQSLNLSMRERLSDLGPLSALMVLQSLDLSWCDRLSDLRPLSTLTALQSLNLSRCEQLSDLGPLSTLTALQSLDLFGCDRLSVECAPDAESLLNCWLGLQKIFASQLRSAPQELASAADNDNCLPRIRAWQADLLQGEASQSTIKLFVLGNGGAGKTQISRRLKGDSFDASVKTTHGIEIGHFSLEGANHIQVNLWDFGGQDIYLGTHALFLDERAVYLIVWTPELEQKALHGECYEENGIPMRHRPLQYWLDYVASLASKKAPVIVVQAQCDWESQRQIVPLPADWKWLRSCECSAKEVDGLDLLKPMLKRAAKFLTERYGRVRLPASWVAVEQALRPSEARKTIGFEDYEQLCREQYHITAPSAVLEYLHRSGGVFWRKGLFHNQIILDQSWALDGVYSVYHRENCMPHLRAQRGLFTRQQLNAYAWKGRFTDHEQKLFISLMQQCQICFHLEEDWYLAPDMLPDVKSADVQARIGRIWRGASADVQVTLRYGLLHDGILRAMLSGIGGHAKVDAAYWRYGVCFYDIERETTAHISSTQNKTAGDGSILIKTAGRGAATLAEILSRAIQNIRIGQQPEVTSSAPLRDKEIAVNTSFDAIKPGPVPSIMKNVYVSYAWSGPGKPLLQKLATAVAAQGYELHWDARDTRSGDWISDYMREIGRAERVIIMLSKAYLESPYCMRELLYLYQHSLGDKREFLNRVVPLVFDELKIGHVIDRLAWVKHWINKADELEAITRGIPVAALGNTPLTAAMIEGFKLHTAMMLEMVNDVLMPRGIKDIRKDNFAQVLAALGR